MQTSEPPSHEQTRADPRATARWISTQLNGLYSTSFPARADIDRTAYLHIYTGVWTYIHTLPEGPKGPTHDTIEARGEELYSLLSDIISAHCRESLALITSAGSGEGRPPTLLRTYLQQWEVFLRLRSLASHLFSKVEDRWMRAANDEIASGSRPGPRILNIAELHFVIWKRLLLVESKSIPDAIVAVQQMVREARVDAGENETLLRNCIASLDTVGFALANGDAAASEPQT